MKIFLFVNSIVSMSSSPGKYTTILTKKYRNLVSYGDIIENQLKIKQNYENQKNIYIESIYSIDNSQDNSIELFNKDRKKKEITDNFNILYPLETSKIINKFLPTPDFFADDTYYPTYYLEKLTDNYHSSSHKNVKINKNISISINHNFYTGIRFDSIYKHISSKVYSDKLDDTEELYNVFLMCFLDTYYNNKKKNVTKIDNIATYNADGAEVEKYITKLSNRLNLHKNNNNFLYIKKVI
jgi:hypothetical protein